MGADRCRVGIMASRASVVSRAAMLLSEVVAVAYVSALLGIAIGLIEGAVLERGRGPDVFLLENYGAVAGGWAAMALGPLAGC